MEGHQPWGKISILSELGFNGFKDLRISDIQHCKRILSSPHSTNPNSDNFLIQHIV